MRIAIRAGLAALALGAVALPALAAESDACASFKWPLDRERAALTAPDLPTLASGNAYPAIASAVSLALSPQDAVAYAVKPARAPKSNPAYGGQLVLADGPGGLLQVTLSDDAWVDLVQDGKVLRSTAFSGKAGCPGVRKSVRFTTGPGPVTISISDSPSATIRLDIAPAQ
jgi:hypothetical protein